MTSKEINDLKREHNRLQEEGREVYAKLVDLHAKCLALQDRIREAEGNDYDDIPLLFGSGFWIDESL